MSAGACIKLYERQLRNTACHVSAKIFDHMIPDGQPTVAQAHSAQCTNGRYASRNDEVDLSIGSKIQALWLVAQSA
jgi:hypothetical protein